MAPHNNVKAEREKKLKSLLAFASTLTTRINASHDPTLLEDLQNHMRGLPFPVSSTVTAKHDELDRVGTELWNLSTRLRRDDEHRKGRTKDGDARHKQTLCQLRVFAFMLLDSAGGQATKNRTSKVCIRLIKIALKAARVCVENGELGGATKVLERAADYQEALGKEGDGEKEEQKQVGERLRMEYFAVRTMLAWKQDRMDTAEHMFSKSRQLRCALDPSAAESFADLLYEMGKDLLGKRNYEGSVRWLERAYDILGEQDLQMLSPEVSELRLSIMQSIVQAYMKQKGPETQMRAWDIVKLLEEDFGDKMIVSLLKLELLSTAESIDINQFYTALLKMIRTVVLNETNFKTIMHHIRKIKEESNTTASKALDDLIEIRLFREEKQAWIERALITRIWIGTSTLGSEDTLEGLQYLFDKTLRKTKDSFSAPATHAAQTLLWKRLEAAYSQNHHEVAESWCRLCLHPLFEKAGETNKTKIARKVIMCALARPDYAAAQEMFTKMSDIGRDEPITRYLMYKVALHSQDVGFAAECLDKVSQQSSKDATLLYACVLEAQSVEDKRQAIIALECVLKRYDYGAPAGIHLPALLRCTARLSVKQLTEGGELNLDVLEQICKVFDGACTQAKASRRRPSTPAQQLFTSAEFEWFSKNAYNLCLKYCAEMDPEKLVRLLNVCIEFIKLLIEAGESEDKSDLSLRLMFCHFLAACAFTTLARAEDNNQDRCQHYLLVQKSCQAFRSTASEEIAAKRLNNSAIEDILSKHFQVVKLEMEAVLKLEKWNALDELYDECWKHKSPDHYETLADLVLVVHSVIVQKDLERKYQQRVLSVIEKIINLTWRESNNDIVKLSRWIRCLFRLALTFDEKISLGCLDKATQIAAGRQGELNHYPPTELEWLAMTSFNLAVDYYVREDDAKCRVWGEKALGISQWAEDGGRLRDVLMGRWKGIRWES
ncbi:SPO22-domain-containing protein [Amniculicola lignicola CBS 123094]|uniref:Protein ZIP4 homolog n=1 Tax=Amniculicola lignicola CBS 123094 TaxID=1392246 RepID=A0A6A5WFH7_9PLEO|nr:SPO22-domain-containing protein [Amniculicola lignicola CBS 123094]